MDAKTFSFVCVLLVLSFSKANAWGRSEAPCFSGCICTYQTFSCVDQNFNQSLLEEITKQLEDAANSDYLAEIKLIGNDFPDMEGFFVMQEMSYLESLILSSNNIRNIDGFTFKSMEGLRVLDLQNNSIVNFGTYTFSAVPELHLLNLRNAFARKTENGTSFTPDLAQLFEHAPPALERLSLADNDLKEIPDQGAQPLFCNMPKLQELDFSQNQLHNLNLTAKCVQNIRDLDLSINHIHLLSSDDMRLLESMEQLQAVNLSVNPFQCDCHSYEFLQWLQNSSYNFRFTNEDSMRCSIADPSSYEGTSLFSVNLTLLACPTNRVVILTLDPRSGMGIFWIGFLSFIAVSTVVLAVKYRERIRYSAYRVRMKFRRSKYKSLDLCDNEEKNAKYKSLDLSDDNEETTENTVVEFEV